jgi:hypothetical protein
MQGVVMEFVSDRDIPEITYVAPAPFRNRNQA